MLFFDFTPKPRTISFVVGIVVFFGLVSRAVSAPSNWQVRTWQTDEGLPDNSVTGLVQTEDGYLWVATLGGLIRFNGARFDEFSTLHLPGVLNRVVRKMFMDRHGRLWLAMDRGSVVCVGPNSARVYDQKDGLENSRISGIAEDAAGAIWLVGGSTFYRIFDDKISRFSAEEGLPSGGNSWIAADAKGELWFARGTEAGVFRKGEWRSLLHCEQSPVRLCAAQAGGLWVCDGVQILKFSEESKPEEHARLPARAVVTMMFEDHTGALWIGTAVNGLFRLSGNTLERVETSNNEILCETEDREGNLWVGTAGGGLNLLRPRAIDLIGTKAGLPSESIRSICQDADGWFWAAMNNGSIARGRSNQWNAVTEAEGRPAGNVTCVAPGREGGVWIGTRDRGLWFLHAGKFQQWGRDDGLGSMFIYSLLAASNGDLWIATHLPDRLVRFHNGQFQPLEMPGEVRVLRALAEGTDGTIWAGTSGGQTLRVSGSAMVQESAVRESRPLSVRSLHVTPDGSLWIGYAGWGVGRVWNGRYARITMTNGLHDDYISQIQSDGQGRLWFTGNLGLFWVRQEEMMAATEGREARVRSVVFGRSEGLSSLQAAFDGSPNVCRSADGQLWFATRNGLLRIRPGDIRDNTNPPPVVLERVAVDDHTVALWDSRLPLRTGADTNSVDLRDAHAMIPLAPGHRKIEFEFAALSFTSPENVNFRYRLENFDKDWVEAGTQRAAKYPQLPPGRYKFQVQACNNAGVWNEAGVRLALEVSPFFWQTWWFRLLVLGLFTISIVGLVRYFSFRRLQRELVRLEQQAALQRERARIAHDMHDEVGSKLSRLSLLGEMASHQPEMPASARGDVAEISETARDTIRSFEQIVWAVNPKNDSLPDLVNYLCRFAEELFEGTETQCVFDVPDKIPAIELSTETRHHIFLAAKEALNNAFKHAAARCVCVRFTLTGEEFEIAIDDDGRGFAVDAPRQREGSGNGLENMRERMKSAGGRVELQSQPGKGSRVIFRVRCPNAPER